MPPALLLLLGVLGIILILWGRAREEAARSNADPDLDTLGELARAGSDVARVHEMEFFLYLPGEAAAKAAGQQLEGEGFTVQVQPTETEGDWLCLATRQMVPTIEELRRLRRHFVAVAESRDGAYDGWGATVITPEDRS